jgi:hypothetical protein
VTRCRCVRGTDRRGRAPSCTDNGKGGRRPDVDFTASGVGRPQNRLRRNLGLKDRRHRLSSIREAAPHPFELGVLPSRRHDALRSKAAAWLRSS